MTKNTKGGKSFKKHKKGDEVPKKRILEFKNFGQDYAKVIKILGDRRIIAITNDGKEILCTIPGKFRFKVWIKVNDVILISVRDFQLNRADVIYRYDDNEIKKLFRLKEITNVLYEDNLVTTNQQEGDVIEFEESGEETEETEETDDIEDVLDNL